MRELPDPQRSSDSNAEVELTADSTHAGQGSMVRFLLKSVPGVVEGQVMSVDIDKTSWIPDDDSLGGDYTTAQASGACPWDNVASNYRQCSRGINSSGTLKVVGGVNGKYFEKSWHITRTDAYPILTATKYFVNAGQLDTFIVRMSDGSAFTTPSPAWSWVADSGVAASAVNCKTANPCPGRINESGWVRVRVAHNFVFKHTKVHITVGPPPRLKITPDEVSVLLGDTIRFTTSAGDAPYLITGWAFRGAPIVSCGTAKQCDFRPPHAGEVQVFGTVDHEPDSDTAVVTVRLNQDDTGALITITPDSSTVSVLTVAAERGVTMTPSPAKYVLPKDTVVTLIVDSLPGYTETVTFLDDSLTGNHRTVSMSRSHSVLAGARPDYLSNPEIAALAARFHALLYTDLDKRASYASLIQSHIALERSTSAAFADSIFSIARVMGVNPFQQDSAAMRALDEVLDATRFFIIQDGNGIRVSYQAPALIALRAGPPNTANDVLSGGKRIRIMFVNGVHNDYPAATAGRSALTAIVEQFHAEHGTPDDTLVELFHNPDYKTQRAEWSTDIMCGQVFSRYDAIFGWLVAAKRYADCLQVQAALSLMQVDLVEALSARNAALNNMPAPFVYGVEQLARRIQALNDKNMSAVIVAHSQGNLVTRDAIQKLRGWQGQPANADSTCVAQLALASPLPKSHYVALLDSAHVRALTARRDILDFLGVVDDSIQHFDSKLTREADAVLAQIDASDAPGGHFGLSLAYALRVHEVAPNFFRDSTGAPLVKARLLDLVNSCLANP